MSLRVVEVVPLIPLTFVAVIRWIRDRNLYNRTSGWAATRVQLKALFLLYPVWVFLTWTTALQFRRNVGFALISTTGSQLVEHITTISLLNDSFLQTKQQVISSIFGLIIAYLWTVYNFMAFSIEDEEDDIETNYTECDCGAAP